MPQGKTVLNTPLVIHAYIAADGIHASTRKKKKCCSSVATRPPGRLFTNTTAVVVLKHLPLLERGETVGREGEDNETIRKIAENKVSYIRSRQCVLASQLTRKHVFSLAFRRCDVT